jgi:hypothetical protein
MLIEELGLKVTKRSTPEEPNRYQDPLEPYLAAEIDFEWEVTPAIADDFDLPDELVGTIQNGEVKTVHPFAGHAFGEAESDEIPIEYAAQAMHGLMVTGRQAHALRCALRRRQPRAVLHPARRRHDPRHARARARLLARQRARPRAAEPVNLPDVVELFHRAPASRTVATPRLPPRCSSSTRTGRDQPAAGDRRDPALRNRRAHARPGGRAARGGRQHRAHARRRAWRARAALRRSADPRREEAVAGAPRRRRRAREAPRGRAACAKPISFFKFQHPPKPKAPKSSRRKA